MKFYKNGFTLVELIIVITILAILGSIAFVSFSGNVGEAKKVRLESELVSAGKGMDIFKETTGKYLLGENNIEISYSGELLGYQGSYTSSDLAKIGIKTNVSSVLEYGLSKDLKKIKLVTFSDENLSFIDKTYASENLDNMIVGNGNYYYVLDSVGEKLTSNTDLKDGNDYNLYYNQNNIVTGSGVLFSEINYITDTKDYEYLKNLEDFDNFISGKTIVTIYSRKNDSNSSDILYSLDFFDSIGVNIIDLTNEVWTVASVEALNPDLVFCDAAAWACSYNSLNILYDDGYSVFTHGNDTGSTIYPIKYSPEQTKTDGGRVYPNGSDSFLKRGWTSIYGSGKDSRRRIMSVYDGATILGYDSNMNLPELILIEGTGKWIHNQALGLNEDFLKRALVYLLTD